VDWAPEISTIASLVVIVVAMIVATVASLLAARREKTGQDAASR
jgi:tellurite resistance protein TerC